MTATLTKEQAIQQFQIYKQDLNKLAAKISELDAEKEEHQVVIDTLSPLSPDRTCFRLVGGVLVQGDISKTLPVLTSTRDSILGIMRQLAEAYKKKEDELIAHQKLYNIQQTAN